MPRCPFWRSTLLVLLHWLLRHERSDKRMWLALVEGRHSERSCHGPLLILLSRQLRQLWWRVPRLLLPQHVRGWQRLSSVKHNA